MFAVVALALVITLGADAAPIGTAFTYQGVLKEAGVPADGSYDFVFRLFDDGVAGAQVGSNLALNGVTVTGGLFTEELDFGDVFDGTALWLEIEVGGVVLGSRQQLAPTPYALFAPNGRTELSSAATALGAPGETSVTSPSCLTGTQPMSGGCRYDATVSSARYQLIETYPDGNAWTCTWLAEGAIDGKNGIATVICASP